MRNLGQRAGLRLPVGIVPEYRAEIVGQGRGEVLGDDLEISYKPFQDLCGMDHLACSPQLL
jgi:hypothetical protein